MGNLLKSIVLTPELQLPLHVLPTHISHGCHSVECFVPPLVALNSFPRVFVTWNMVVFSLFSGSNFGPALQNATGYHGSVILAGHMSHPKMLCIVDECTSTCSGALARKLLHIPGE